jgi:hypothetical protein
MWSPDSIRREDRHREDRHREDRPRKNRYRKSLCRKSRRRIETDPLQEVVRRGRARTLT